MAIRRRGNELGLVLLASQLFNYGFGNIPPATLALIAGQTAIYLDMLPKYFPSATNVCMSTYLVYEHQDWRRMILATFYHAHDFHLYFNMLSLLYKGSMLEKKFGTPYFAYLVAVFTVLTSSAYVGLGLLFSELFHNQSYLMSCAVGFSGVLFALKVLTTYYSSNATEYLFGIIPIPSKYFYWAELILIQLVTPNASFVGHLAGILVGIAYVYGPLKILMDSVFPPGGPRARTSGFQNRQPEHSSSFPNFFSRGSRFSSSGTPSPNYRRATPSAPSAPYGDHGGQERFSGYQPRNSYSQYTGGLSEEEQYLRAVEESARENQRQPPNSQRLYPDLDDLRSRRERFYH